MKLTALLFFFFSVTVFAEGLSQSVSFTGKSVPLSEVFAVIKQQTGFVVFYNNDVLAGSKPVSLSVKNEPLSSFLSLVFSHQPLSYSVKKKTIVVKKNQLVTLDFKNSSLQQVFNEIEKQTGYKFLNVSQVINSAKPVTINVKNAPIEQVLDLCFKDQPLEYEMKGNTVIIEPKKKGDKSTYEILNPNPPIDVRGRVVDEKGEPVEGATVTVKGTSKGTSTNVNGEFVLKNVSENAVLEITYVGYETQKLSIRGKSLLFLNLKSKVSTLDEMQVIGYGTTTKRFNTGNVSSVKAADIEKQPVNNPLLALQGRILGLEISQVSGVTGSGVSVKIQGQNSIIKGNDPLIYNRWSTLYFTAAAPFRRRHAGGTRGVLYGDYHFFLGFSLFFSPGNS